MITQLKDSIDKIALMLVIASAEDRQGLDFVLDLQRELIQQLQSANNANFSRLLTACQWTTDQSTNWSTKELYDQLNSFVAAANAFVDNPNSATFPNEQSTTVAPIEDLAPSIDPAFLSEYIETHTLALDEFESWLVRYRMNPATSDAAALSSQVKSYLHNIKGDSGAIGLLGIEKVTHFLEDLLDQRSVTSILEQLISYKEWIVGSLRALTDGKPLPETASTFLARLNLSNAEFARTSAVTTSTVNVVSEPPRPAAPVAPTAKVDAPKLALESYSISGEADLMSEFIAEAEEHLGNVEGVILDAETAVTSEHIDTIFRAVHSLKGGSAYFTLQEITKTSHILENLLSEAREGKRQFDETLAQLTLQYVDLQKSLLAAARNALSAGGQLSWSPESKQFLQQLEAYAAGQQKPAELAPIAASSSPERDHEAATGDNRGGKLDVKNFVKVDTVRLDHLVNSVGEMVIYSSMLIRHCRALLGDNREVMDAASRVEKFARDLQDIGMSMRLVPIKGLFQKMSRLVWDTSKKLGKDIQFTMEGEDTELDRNLIDKLADPLMHMVRNSLDHGIENPADRERSGKSAQGHVRLAAFHSAGSIHIQIQDDGRGLNPDKLRAKALEKGIITPDEKLTEEETFALIFAPGFSTATQVTDISGRGVGMDVVRRNVEALRGRIQIKSVVGEGSTFTIELPLTLAIMDGIQVRVGQEHFLVPSLSIVEFIRPEPGSISRAMNRAETFRFRDQYLPVFRLCELYDINPEFEDPYDATLMIVENSSELVAIMVDEILGEYSTVIKSLGELFGEAKGFSGCAIMPGGEISLILDIRSLVQLARKTLLSREPKSNKRVAPIVDSSALSLLYH